MFITDNVYCLRKQVSLGDLVIAAEGVVLLAAMLLLLLGVPVAQAAGITVNSAADVVISGDGQCTLREAIINANNDDQSVSTDCPAGSGSDLITFGGNYTIILTNDLPPLFSNMTIDGVGRAVAISGNSTRRVFNLQGGSAVTLNRLSIISGTVESGTCPFDCGGGILVTSGTTLTLNYSTLSSNTTKGDSEGGGIYNDGLLLINYSNFSNNSAPSSRGGGISNNGTLIINHAAFSNNSALHSGGGIFNSGALTVNHSTFSGNSANRGGGIFNFGALTVNHSTFSGNSADDGGGILLFANAEGMVNNSTFSNNSAGQFGGGIDNENILTVTNSTFRYNSADDGGGIKSFGTQLHLRNTIIANSPSGGDCSSLGPATNLNNLVEDGSCNPLLSGDPALGPLQDNGGSTFTHALLPGSQAIDAGNPIICPLTDQRDINRPLDGNGNGVRDCDIGAFEAPDVPGIQVWGNNVLIANGDTSPSPADHTDFGLVVVAGSGVTRTFTILNAGIPDLLLTGSPSVVINGAAADFNLTTPPATPINGGGSTIFQLTFNPTTVGLRTATLTITNNDPDDTPYTFTIQGTACAGAITVAGVGDSGPGTLRQALADICNGGMIDFAGALASQTINLTSAELNISKTVTITNPNAPNLAISGNNARRVFNIQSGGVVTLSHLSIISGAASASSGGGILVNPGAMLMVNHSLFSSNSASDFGGGIANFGTVLVNHSTFSDNSSTNPSFGGGGLYNDIGMLVVNHSTFSGNSADINGGGIYLNNGGLLTVTNSTLSGNLANNSGGGIYNFNGTLTVNHSTFSGNSASDGSGIGHVSGALYLYNSIVANGLSGGDCSGTPAINVNNLIEDNSCGSALSGDPHLGPLQDNGGGTFTHALLSGSLAIDAADTATCLPTDQRGVSRPLDGDGNGAPACDIGAFEISPISYTYLPLVVKN